jgi:preprotein translocase subunit SecA
MAFYNSSELSSIKTDVQIIMEKLNVKERELYIKRAAKIGKVTLLTRTFGRGTHFICRNQQLLANGGIHVLQKFFSEELSEEYQIVGREARQGDKDSYRMILLDKDLEWVLGSAWKEELPKIMGDPLYEVLDKARTVRYESRCGANELGIEQCKDDHKGEGF